MYIKRFLPFLVVFAFIACSEQHSLQRTLDPDKKYKTVCIGFYNVENLFDTLDAENVEDEEYTPDGPNSWGKERYEKKLNDLAKVIQDIGTEKTPHGPAILGLAEVENRRVLEDLVETEPIADRNYKIVHHDSPDERGIDVALLYRPDYFTLEAQNSYEVELPKDDKTRDQLLVSGKLAGERIHFMVAHWPSRSGGQASSEPKRVAAAQVGRKVADSIQDAEENAKIVYMGDLNDDPINKSVREVMKAKGSPDKLSEEAFFNPMRQFYEKGIGTLAWRDNWNLFDQVLISHPLTQSDMGSFQFYEAGIYNPSYLQLEEGNFKGYPFRTFVGSSYQGGYSDHFPVYAYLIREADGR